MRTIETTVYKFSELSDSAKEKAIQNLSDINVNDEFWHEYVIEDAETIGLKITEWDINRGYAKGKFTESAFDVAESIFENHGGDSETINTAEVYLCSYEATVCKNNRENADEEFPEDFLDTEEIDAEFLKSLLEDYRIMLSKEYGYLTSEKAIIETIEANEYEFLDNGKLI